MTRITELIPDILEQNIDTVAGKVDVLKGLVDQVHIDIMDGIMVDNLTIDIGQLFDINFPGNLKIDMHLMVEYPEEYLGDCHQIHTYRAMGQIERMHSIPDFIHTARELGILPCLAIDLPTPVEAIDQKYYADIDGILVMSVKAGWSGQKFQHSSLDKVRKFRELGFRGHIIMDGGMDSNTICPSFQAGADQFAINSYFWTSPDKKAALEIFCD